MFFLLYYYAAVSRALITVYAYVTIKLLRVCNGDDAL